MWVAVAGIWVTTMLGLVAVALAFPVLPRYVTIELGAGNVEVGVVVGAFAVTALIVRPIAGRLADLRGRKAVVVSGALASALGGALYFLPLGVPGLVFARLVVGAGEGMVFVAGSAWVMDIAPPNRRARAIGLYGLSVWSGLALGPLVGEGLLRLASFEAVWVAAAALPLIGAGIASRVRESPRALDSTAAQALGGWRSFVVREAIGPGSALACATVGFAAISSFVVLHLEARGVGGGALAFTAFAATVVLTRLIGGDIPDRVGSVPAALVAGIVEVAGLAMIGAAQTLPVAIVGCILMGAAFSTLFPALSVMVVNRVPEARRGAALGTFTAFFDLGVGVGAPLVGAVAHVAGLPEVFYAAAAFALGTVALMSLQWRALRATAAMAR